MNCYLIQSGAEYGLIDTGGPGRRRTLVEALERFGCRPGQLRLVAITHGDFDHTGNAAFLRDHYGTKIAMHSNDALMAERGDMFAGRNRANALLRWLVPKLSGFGRDEYFKPDIQLEDGDDLSAYGLAATVVSIPGHSQGSIGLLTSGGDLFCGDLLENTKQPRLGSIMDDPETAQASLSKLREYNIGMVYPGHGQPFEMSQLNSL